MQPTNTILDRIAALLAEDTTTLANATPLGVHLAKAPFSPAVDTDPATLTQADFDGYAVLTPPAGAQLHYDDPVTGQRTVELKPPTGGYHYDVTGVTNLPQTIYGVYVTDGAGTTCYGSFLLDTPVPLSAAGQGFDIGGILFRFLNQSPQ